MDSSISFSSKSLIRIDDISLNIDEEKLRKFLSQAQEKYPSVEFLLAVSPAVFDMPLRAKSDPKISERVFPSILNAYSDHREFYKVEKVGVPAWLDQIVDKFRCKVASHGLIHVDHRLLSRSAQELSIVSSLALVKGNIFVPPFNKYNQDTISICEEHKIDLIKWEDGWKHLGYQPFQDDGSNYYVHFHDYPGDEIFKVL
jgi:hypothetical protein